MSKLKVYYAHTMTSYGSTIEEQDVNTLIKLGFEIINPNQKKYQDGCKLYIKENGRDKVMDYFKDLIDECDLIAFRSIPDGRILSGIAFEVNYALEQGKEVIELPCSIKNRMLDYPTTKQYLIDLGHYKV